MLNLRGLQIIYKNNNAKHNFIAKHSKIYMCVSLPIYDKLKLRKVKTVPDLTNHLEYSKTSRKRAGAEVLLNAKLRLIYTCLTRTVSMGCRGVWYERSTR